MNKVICFSGGEKVPELEALTKEINEFSEAQNVSIQRIEIINHITVKAGKGKDSEPVQSVIPVAVVTFKNN